MRTSSSAADLFMPYRRRQTEHVLPFCEHALQREQSEQAVHRPVVLQAAACVSGASGTVASARPAITKYRMRRLTTTSTEGDPGRQRGETVQEGSGKRQANRLRIERLSAYNAPQSEQPMAPKKGRKRPDRARAKKELSRHDQRSGLYEPFWGMRLDCFRPIVTSLKSYARASTEPVPAHLIPDAATLAELVKVAYWTTLSPDEGRFPAFSLMYSPIDDGRCIPLAARPLAVESLARLAPGVSRTAHLVVHRTEVGLQILGVYPGTTGCIQVRGVAPGRVIVQLSHDNLAVFDGNRALDLLTDTHDGRIVHGLGRWHVAHTIGNAFSDTLTPIRRELTGIILLMLVESLRAQHHGGTILVLPPDSSRRADKWLDFGSHATRFKGLTELVSHWASKIPSDTPSGHVAKRIPMLDDFLMRRPVDSKFQSFIDSVAILGSVDGALVLTHGLRLRGFGTMIRVPKSAKRYETNVKTYSIRKAVNLTKSPISHLGGSRRRSAATFVANNYDTLALTASQDGPLTMTAWFRDAGCAVGTDLELLLD
jgi:hypothetical protein